MNPSIYIGNYLTDKDRLNINNYIANYKRKNDGFKIEVVPIRDRRSLKQNKFYWGIMVKNLMEATGEGKNTCDYIYKYEYKKAHNIKDIPSTSEMDIQQMMIFIDFCVAVLTGDEYNYLGSINDKDYKDLQEIRKLSKII